MKTHKHLHLARRKMSRIIDELYTALLHYGSGKVEMRIMKKEDGLCLQIESDFAPEHIKHTGAWVYSCSLPCAAPPWWRCTGS